MPVGVYPNVRGEYATVHQLVAGKSIGRLGDGELKVATGSAGGREDHRRLNLTHEMQFFLRRPHRDCIVGIPTMDQHGPKYDNWKRHIPRFNGVLSPDVTYYSSFITRPDSAPWINHLDYARLLESTWRNKLVMAIAPVGSSLVKVVSLGAGAVRHIVTGPRNSFKEIDELERKAVAAAPDIVIISAGPTATVLANRLSMSGLQAIDLGSAGGFLYKILGPVYGK